MGISKERTEELEASIRNPYREIMESQRGEGRLNKEKVIKSVEKNAKALFSGVNKTKN